MSDQNNSGSTSATANADPDKSDKPPAPPPTGDGKSGESAQPTADELTDNAFKAFSELKDDAPAEEKAKAREVLTKAQAARQAEKQKQAEEKTKADAAAKAKADAEAKQAEEAKKLLVTSADQVKAPKDSLIPKSRLDAIAKEAIDKKLSLTQADQLVQQAHAFAEEMRTEGLGRLKAQGESWRAEILKDPKLGGQNINATDQKATRAFKTLFGEEVFKEFATSVYANHPGFIRGLVSFADRVGESRLVKDTMPPNGKTQAKSLGAQVYAGAGHKADVEA